MTSNPYALDDPRPIAAEAPYTYFLPSHEELAALAPGDLVKLCFRANPASDAWDAERMWVKIERVDGEILTGRLDNDPDDIPGLESGDLVTFGRHTVTDCIWSEDRENNPPDQPQQRTYWQRCLVDRCVTNEGAKVHYLYREEPEIGSEGDKYPDSGWRIRGDYRGLSDSEIDARETEYVALGRVLNADDSWLHLVDEPIGCRFIRDWETGEFVPEG